MAFTYKQLQEECKRRATRDQGGTQFDTAIKNIINTSLFRVAREAPWRVLRKTGTITTVSSYTTGTGAGAFTNASKNVTVTGATFLTDGVKVGRRLELSGSTRKYKVATITGETTFTTDIAYDGTTTIVGTYEIFPQEEYNLPIQSGHRMFLWHEEETFPIQMTYVTEQDFYDSSVDLNQKNTPLVYRMWGTDMITNQVLEASVITISSSSTADQSKEVTVFGTVEGQPDSEVLTTDNSDGTTLVVGSKSFSQVERVVKSATTVGRIIATANTANVTVATIPAGNITSANQVRKIRVWPLPDTVFNINVWYYKDPYRLVNDGDVNELGQEFDEAIILMSVAKLKAEQNQDEAEKFFALYQDELRTLRRTNMDKMDFFARLRRPQERGGLGGSRVHRYLFASQAGPNFGIPGRR